MTFWENKKVLITGHTGFKGSWLSLILSQLGADVYGLSLKVTKENILYKSALVSEVVSSKYGDIRDRSFVEKSFQEFSPDIVFHLAAQPIVRKSYLDPIETYATNVLGTVNILQSCFNTPSVGAVVNITSDKCYRNEEWVWPYRENDPMGGHDPYSASKGCAEIVTSSYISSFYSIAGKGLASARAGNVIGGGDFSTDRLVPDIVNGLVNSEPTKLRYPQAIRPWQHVFEPLHGYLTLGEKLWGNPDKISGGWNFGPSARDARTVEWVADTICKEWGCPRNWTTTAFEQPHEANVLRLDCSKAAAELGWRPSLSINDAIKRTVDWYKLFFSGADMSTLSRKDIKDYGFTK
jgi:CDP-glucose 4,6-dehydratase